MKAAWYTRNGAARDVLCVGELPDPHPGPGEVRVRVGVSGVNPSDAKTRAGTARQIAFERQVPGSDAAGVIDEVGDGVAADRLGQRVWTYNAAWQRPGGASAQLVVLPAAQAVPLPARAGLEAGACLGIPAITAHRAVFADGPPTGRTVLVQGGAGVVGHYAVQLAKWAGARVIATINSPEKAEHAKAGGADDVIDYEREDVAERVLALTGGEGVDRVIEVEFGGNLAVDLRVAKMGGVIAAYASTVREPQIPFFPLLSRNLVLRLVHMYGLPQEAKDQAVRDIVAWIESGRAHFAVAARFPLDRVVQAHELVEAGSKVGHVLLDIPQE